MKTLIATAGILFMTTYCNGQAATATWKTYTNSQYGFSFQYPATWVVDQDKDIVVSGKVLSRSIHFVDNSSKTSLLISYTLSKGAEIYDFYIKNYDPSHSKRITVDGTDAIQITTIDNRTGKARLLNRKDWAKEVNVEFLDKKKTGEFELKFRAHVDNSLTGEIKKFTQLLHGFKFLN